MTAGSVTFQRRWTTLYSSVISNSGCGTGLEDGLLGGEGGVGVEHVNLLAVGAGGLEEGEPVGLVLGEGLLVAVDDVVGVVVEVAEGDEAFALAGLVRSGDGVGLGVAVKSGVGLFLEDASGAPVFEGGGGASVDVLAGLGVGRVLLTKDDANEVVGAGGVVGVLHGRGDLVVGLGDDVGHGDYGGVVTEGAERVQTGHGVIVRLVPNRWDQVHLCLRCVLCDRCMRTV